MAVEYDLVIIGGGSGGLVVASAAAQLKAKVALIEKDRLGGDCLWFGCVPSKSFIHGARVAYEVAQSERFGVYTNPPEIKFAETMSHVQKVIQTIEPHDSPERFRGLGVEVIFGSGQFLNLTTFEVNGRQLTARAFVIATGSRPFIPPIEGIEEVGYLTNEQVFDLTEQPQSLAVVGAGPIGCELGQSFHRLGTKVTLIASRDQLMPKEDSEAAQVIEEQFRAEGIQIWKQTRASRVEKSVEGKKKLIVTGRDGEQEILVDEILVSAGRTPNLESLNLEQAGVEFDRKGIKVNAKLQTRNRKIYACGDVIGGYQFTHVAGYEATVVLQNALFFPTKKADYRVIPWATFTEPELARVGLTEQQAINRYGSENIRVLKQDFAEVDRANAEGATLGFNKIITTKNGEIIGCHLVGKVAGELIHEVVLAMRHNLKVSALTGTHIYPTLAEINSKTGLLFTKESYAKNQRLQNILQKFFNFRRQWF